jgi:hypothetical protein
LKVYKEDEKKSAQLTLHGLTTRVAIIKKPARILKKRNGDFVTIPPIPKTAKMK